MLPACAGTNRNKPQPPAGPDPKALTGTQPCCLRTQQCAKRSTSPIHRTRFPEPRRERTHGHQASGRHLSIDIPPLSTHRRTSVSDMGISCRTHPPHCGGIRAPEVLLRKEVIQPHLPVRLPCYDLVPIAGPTFDGSLPQGVRPPASGVTNFRDLTGGVYKARERIHRSVADLRLLAIPTS